MHTRVFNESHLDLGWIGFICDNVSICFASAFLLSVQDSLSSEKDVKLVSTNMRGEKRGVIQWHLMCTFFRQALRHRLCPSWWWHHPAIHSSCCWRENILSVLHGGLGDWFIFNKPPLLPVLQFFKYFPHMISDSVSIAAERQIDCSV